MRDKSSNLQCEYCNKEHDGSYGSGRFCSSQCARSFSTSKNRKEINRKISETCRKNAWQIAYKGTDKYQEIEDRRVRKFKDTWRKRRLDTSYHMPDGYLDITCGELDKYREEHVVCEICGCEEKADNSKRGKPNCLAVDHNHDTLHFRGLLCQSCNRMLGWFEKQHDNIEQYLETHDPEWRNGKRR